jgi:exodeoxyribonuclease-5
MKDQTLAPFDYSYAITVHKSQGSQYDSVVIFEEYLGDPDVHKKWLYTAITRGIREVTLVTSK